jgi:hypothetical protein
MKAIPMRAMLAIVAIVLLAAAFAACTGQASDKQLTEQEVLPGISEETFKYEAGDASAEFDKSSASDYDRRGAENLPSPPVPGEAGEKIPTKIIKTADICYQVEKFNKSRRQILDVVNRFHAYVSAENQSNDGYRINNTLVIRAESAIFDTLVEALMAEAIYVEYKQISVQDVTEEFVDVVARLKSKKEMEAQYFEILKKARSIDEILAVQQYLRVIREEIESFEGRLKYLNDRVAYSTITLRFYEKLDAISRQPDRSFGTKIAEAFSWGWSGLKTFFIGIIFLWPVWVILGITAWLLVFFIKRGRKKRRAKAAADARK